MLTLKSGNLKTSTASPRSWKSAGNGGKVAACDAQNVAVKIWPQGLGETAFQQNHIDLKEEMTDRCFSFFWHKEHKKFLGHKKSHKP